MSKIKKSISSHTDAETLVYKVFDHIEGIDFEDDIGAEMDRAEVSVRSRQMSRRKTRQG